MGAGLVLTWLTLAWGQEMPASVAVPVVRYEYTTVCIAVGKGDCAQLNKQPSAHHVLACPDTGAVYSKAYADCVVDGLNRLGAQGWRLIGPYGDLGNPIPFVDRPHLMERALAVE